MHDVSARLAARGHNNRICWGSWESFRNLKGLVSTGLGRSCPVSCGGSPMRRFISDFSLMGDEKLDALHRGFLCGLARRMDDREVSPRSIPSDNPIERSGKLQLHIHLEEGARHVVIEKIDMDATAAGDIAHRAHAEWSLRRPAYEIPLFEVGSGLFTDAIAVRGVDSDESEVGVEGVHRSFHIQVQLSAPGTFLVENFRWHAPQAAWTIFLR